MKDIFSEIGIEPTKENKKDIDRKVHELLDIEYKNCSSTWRKVKETLSEDRVGFIQNLQSELVTG